MNIKGMDKNMQCQGFQFEVGKEYKIDTQGRTLELCTDTVFHYCKSLSQVHNFYDCRNESNRYFEIEVLGEEITDGKKCGSNHIKIVREIVGEELIALKGLDGTNTGLFNLGYWNVGYENSGNWNTGNKNSGDSNSGNWNSGYGNTGNWNAGNGNSGKRNSGSKNSGDWNAGSWNSGVWNSGHWNAGIANKCDFSNGIFCNENDMNIRIFNKPSGMSLINFLRSDYWVAMCSVPFLLTEWIYFTDEEKTNDLEKDRVGGYLKVYTYEEAWANWWERLTDKNKEIIKQIPNFDPVVFKDITGIEV